MQCVYTYSRCTYCILVHTNKDILCAYTYIFVSFQQFRFFYSFTTGVIQMTTVKEKCQIGKRFHNDSGFSSVWFPVVWIPCTDTKRLWAGGETQPLTPQLWALQHIKKNKKETENQGCLRMTTQIRLITICGFSSTSCKGYHWGPLSTAPSPLTNRGHIWFCSVVVVHFLSFCLSLQGKEGAFMVRESRQRGVYTVSVFTKAAG